VIRLVTLDPMDPEIVQKLCRLIYQAYGLGCEYAGEVEVPEGQPKELDAVSIIDALPKVRSFADDKVVYLTSRPLAPRMLPSGKAPTPGFAKHGGDRALVSTHGLPTGDALLKRVGKQILNDVAHIWSLHHVLDPRCSMHPPWAPTFLTGEPLLCPFCRDKSDERIRLAKT